MVDLNPEHNKELEQPTVFTFGDRFALINASRSIEAINRKIEDIQKGILDKVESTHTLVNSLHSIITNMNATVTKHDQQLEDFKKTDTTLDKIVDDVKLLKKIVFTFVGMVLLAFAGAIINLIIK